LAVRIYTLAKELKIENRELVDACTKVGITGKGSALASLTDDEVAKVKSFLKDGPAPPKPKKSAAPTRDAIVAPERREAAKPTRPGVLPKRAKRIEEEAVEEDSVEETVADSDDDAAVEEQSETPVAEEASVEDSDTKAESEAKPKKVVRGAKANLSEGSASPLGARLGKDAPQRPSDTPIRGGRLNSGSKVRSLDNRKRSNEERTEKAVEEPAKKPEPPKETKEAKPKGRKTVLNLKAMPTVSQPSQEKKKAEPKAQKPVIALPTDAIRAHQKGEAAPLREFTKSASKKKGKKDSPEMIDAVPSKGGSSKGRRGRGGEDGDVDLKMGSTRNQRARGGRPGATGSSYRPRRNKRRGQVKDTSAPRKDKVTLELPCSLREFCEAAGVQMGRVMPLLMKMELPGININMMLDQELVELLVLELDVDLDIREAESLEDTVVAGLLAPDEDESKLVPRPPVVTFLGHVDHGKTSLLDYLIGINVVKGEAGGITQHIRAYQIDKDGRKISFVDTPGHEAFTEMRARGANVTDVAVLVIAADDGIMPQTEEAISHVKAAGVPIVVALNKCDLQGVDTNRILQQLTEHELLPSEWGGDVEVVRTSAITGEGMDELLETILFVTEANSDPHANPDRPATGVCLEAQQEGGRGVVAKVIVKNGTLRPGDIVLCGGAHGRVKAMYDTLNEQIRHDEAGPSVPVNITGLDLAPSAGDTFVVLDDIAQAREIAENRVHDTRTGSLGDRGDVRTSFIDFQTMLESGTLGQTEEKVTLNLILRADVRGTIEAITKELGKLSHPEVEIKVLQASVGGVTVADVTLAHASQAVIIGFNVIPDEAARALADTRGVEIRRYNIIYKVTDDIRALLEGKLKPEQREVELGRALVQQAFTISRIGTIAGCRVLAGTVERGCRIRINREGRTIGDYPVDSVRREKEDVKEVRQGMECGIKLLNFNDIKEGDLLEAYKIEEVARTLEMSGSSN
jgi:translation initiation factor IF-2